MKKHNYVDEYLQWKGTYAPKACINYGLWIRRFFAQCDKELEDVTVEDVVKFLGWLKGKYQPKSIELAMVIIHNFLDFWKNAGVRCMSPNMVKLPKAKANSHQPIKEDEYHRLLLAINVQDFRSLQKSVIVRMLFDTGVRISELCDLNISDIETGKCSTTIQTKKTNKQRMIFWSMETDIFLIQYLKERNQINSTNALLIGHLSDGTPTRRLTPRSVERMIKKLCDAAGIGKRITPHSFRHGKAHRVLELGGNPKDVQAILGHANPASSFTYLQWNDQEFETRAKKFLT